MVERTEDAIRQRCEMFVAECVFVDIEIGRDGALHALGAIRGDEAFERTGLRDARPALAALDRFAEGATRVVGHNLIGHDLPRMSERAAGLALLGLRAVDTLVLSPLAFPRRPYHQLVKDYKLVRDETSDPVADSRLARRALEDEIAALTRLVDDDPELAALHRSVLAGWAPERGEQSGRLWDAGGTADVFAHVGAGRVPEVDLVDAVVTRFRGVACEAALATRAALLLAEPIRRPALAYALAWLSVAETRSVLPRWVRAEFPEVSAFLFAVRDVPCGSVACAWCAEAHDARAGLKRFFGFDGFRGPAAGTPPAPLQQRIVEAGIAGRPILAILPTSFGKSLCYQLPALVRYRLRAVLTIVVSPLQALMKDQVDVLQESVGGDYAAAIHGMLTPLERAKALERVREGDVALLYVAPEQLRNRSFARAVRAREIGAWVFDEAHCLSKWGHDFRTDYHHAGRFIREFCANEGVRPAPVTCFTATAKSDVRDEIVAYFRNELEMDLDVFESGVERENLTFSVREVVEPEKPVVLDDTLHEHLDGDTGAAIVYLATRRRTEEFARYLEGRRWDAAAFHAGIAAPEKRSIQDRFKRGEVRVVCATSAFGMGIDKSDVRLVVHADVPGSLESYLQEAGRGGRDGLPSHCALLFCPADIDRQFQMTARSRLTRRDIGQILGAVRRVRRGREGAIVVTPYELLADDRTDATIDTRDRDARTKVFTAVSWLERCGFLRREENHTRVFQGRPLVRSIAEAHERMAKLQLSDLQRRRWTAILTALMNSDRDRTGLDMDELAASTGFTAWATDESEASEDAAAGKRRTAPRSAALLLLGTLRDMSRQGLIEEGLVLSAFVRRRIADDSASRLAALARIEDALIEALREADPDAAPEAGEPGWRALDLRRANEVLRGQGLPSSPETLRRVVHSLAEDGRGLDGGHASIVLRHGGGDRYRMRLQRSWDALHATARLRRDVAGHALAAMLLRADADELPPGDVLVAFGSSEVLGHVEEHAPALFKRLHDPVAALERSLLFLHEQRVISLQNGLAVFRQAMGLRLLPEAHGRTYTQEEYHDLSLHYGERTFQTHVMGEYARRGLDVPDEARRLVLDYFELGRPELVERWFPGREDEIARATSLEAYQRVVDDLGNRTQIRIVTSPARGNALVLAGPGSGKTRVVVHRCAYLLLVERVPPTSILVLCFNRSAAHELRVRLRDLVGDVARGVQIHTYHGLALRLTGRSLAEGVQSPELGDDAHPFDFDAILEDALRLLRGEMEVVGFEPDALRERLISGYAHVLVDEYQDVDELQYRLIREIAGRNDDGPGDATLLAVGDDDQNIYAWRGADARYLRRFEEDFEAKRHHLVENHRSTPNIVSAANRLIERNRFRMKERHPLRPTKSRRAHGRGGECGARDRIARGRVQVIHVRDRATQTGAVMDELHRLRVVAGGAPWDDFAVLARTHRELQPVLAWCDATGIPVRRHLGSELLPPLRTVREIARALDVVTSLRGDDMSVAELRAELGLPLVAPHDDPWRALLVRVLAEWAQAAGERPVPAAYFVEFLHEALAEVRRGHVVGVGLFVGTIHGAKGLEFPHVALLGGGFGGRHREPREGQAALDVDEGERRVYFVGMTRARESLVLLDREDDPCTYAREVAAGGGRHVLTREERAPSVPAPGVLDRCRKILSLRDIDLGFAGRARDGDPLHERVRGLSTGAPLTFMADGGRTLICDAAGAPVGALSVAAAKVWAARLASVRSARVFAIVRRERSLTAEAFRDSVRCETWEVPMVEIEHIDD